MAQNDVELVRRADAALQRMLTAREVDRALIEELWTEDCVLRPAGILPESAEMHGHDGIVKFIENQMEAVTVRDGKLARTDMYREKEEALRAARSR